MTYKIANFSERDTILIKQYHPHPSRTGIALSRAIKVNNYFVL
jgi:hypothetical protein